MRRRLIANIKNNFLVMTRPLVYLSFLLIFASCGQEENQNVEINNHLDKEIKERLAKIEFNPENKITRTMGNFFNVTPIDYEIQKLISEVNSKPLDESMTIKINSFFRNFKDISYAEIESYEFIELKSNQPKEDAIIAIKLNELTLLDRLVFTRINKVGETSYSAAFIPTIQTDTSYAGDIILLKTDTLFAQTVLVNLSDTFIDSIYVPTEGGKGKLKVVKEKSPYEFKACGYVLSGGKFFPYKFSEKIKK